MSSSSHVERPTSVAGAAIVGLLFAAAGLAWYVGGSMPDRSLFPTMLAVTAALVALAAPYRIVTAALRAVSRRLEGEE